MSCSASSIYIFAGGTFVAGIRERYRSTATPVPGSLKMAFSSIRCKKRLPVSDWDW